MPVPLIIFIQNLTMKGTYVPNQFLTRYQLNRIDTDNYGAFIDLDDNQLKMVAGIFIFVRIMLMSILIAVANAS